MFWASVTFLYLWTIQKCLILSTFLEYYHNDDVDTLENDLWLDNCRIQINYQVSTNYNHLFSLAASIIPFKLILTLKVLNIKHFCIVHRYRNVPDTYCFFIFQVVEEQKPARLFRVASLLGVARLLIRVFRSC